MTKVKSNLFFFLMKSYLLFENQAGRVKYMVFTYSRIQLLEEIRYIGKPYTLSAKQGLHKVFSAIFSTFVSVLSYSEGHWQKSIPL